MPVTLDASAAMLLAAAKVVGRPPLETMAPAEARAEMLVRAAPLQPDPPEMQSVEDMEVPAPHGSSTMRRQTVRAGPMRWRLVRRSTLPLRPSTSLFGELYEAKGDRAAALRSYREFLDLWRNADKELEPQVADVRRRVAVLERQERSTR